MKLSPINFRGLLDTMALVIPSEPKATPKKRRVRAIECWRCPECFDVHDYEEDAEDCCAAEELKDQPMAMSCPVCAEKAESYRDAADCCLWKDVDAWTRWLIADAVESGSTWLQELGIVNASSAIQEHAK